MSQFSTNFYGWHMHISKWCSEMQNILEDVIGDKGIANSYINLLWVGCYFHLKLQMMISQWYLSRENASMSLINSAIPAPHSSTNTQINLYCASHWPKYTWWLSNLRTVFPILFLPYECHQYNKKAPKTLLTYLSYWQDFLSDKPQFFNQRHLFSRNRIFAGWGEKLSSKHN